MDVTLILALLLSHPTYSVRSAAAESLSRLDWLALPALAAVAEWAALPDPHARHVADELATQIRARPLRRLLAEAETLPWLDALPGIPPATVQAYLARARLVVPKLVCPCSGAPVPHWADLDWIDYRLATLLYRREHGLAECDLELMHGRCRHWRDHRAYPAHPP